MTPRHGAALLDVRALAALFSWLALTIGGSGCVALFDWRYVDNRDTARVRIVSVDERGTLGLADGRQVRPFGIRLPGEPTLRSAALAAIRSIASDTPREATVSIVLEGPIAAADIRVWHEKRYCVIDGSLLPGGSRPQYHDIALSEWVLRRTPEALNEDDMRDERAPAGLVAKLRDAAEGTKRYREAQARAATSIDQPKISSTPQGPPTPDPRRHRAPR